jgi:hypothetical protein
MTPDTNKPLTGSSSRPEWFNKEAVFRSVYETADETVTFLILFDGDTKNHWINKYKVNVLKMKAGNGDLSFAVQIEMLKKLPLNDNDIVYILEDDYIHIKNWPNILREGLGKLQPSYKKFDYVTLYDHPDKYILSDDNLKFRYFELNSSICITKSCHWRTIPNTTNTFAAEYKTLIKDYDIHMKHKNMDDTKFIHLRFEGRTIGSCIPGYSTHCQKYFLTPFIDWAEEIKKYLNCF